MPSTRPAEYLAGDDALGRRHGKPFEETPGARELPEALEGLGIAAWWLDLADLVFDSRERAYRLSQARGDRAHAARVAVWLAWDYWAFRGEGSVATDGCDAPAICLTGCLPARNAHGLKCGRDCSACLRRGIRCGPLPWPRRASTLHERPETSILRCWVATFKVWRLLQTGSIRLGDLSPTESWGDSSQNGLQNVCVVGDTELIWNRQQ
jgi:hypothetical protein